MPHSPSVVHPIPSHGGKDDTNEITKETLVEQLEMTTFEKTNTAKYRGK